MMRLKYVVITPVRDEERYIAATIRSMTKQTVVPLQWIVVDDGSTDRTGKILHHAASQFPWITVLHRPNGSRSDDHRGARAQNAKEIEAFYAGYERIIEHEWDFVVKLDGDVSFEPDYFAKCFEEFAADPKLGIGGGAICNVVDGTLQAETTSQFHVRGATKIYRRACWEEMGGVVRGAGWDTLDGVKANMLGWTSRTFGGLKVAHHKVTGAANGMWRNAVKNGVWSYLSGYHPIYMFFRCGRSLSRKPYVIGSAGLLFGFLSGYLRRLPRIADDGLVQYLRREQLRRLTLRSGTWR